MRNNTTHLRLTAGRAKRAGLSTRTRSFSPNISTNYKMMLQIYYINKVEMAKKDLKYQKTGVRKSGKARMKPVLLISGIMSILEESLLLLKKLKPKFPVATISE